MKLINKKHGVLRGTKQSELSEEDGNRRQMWTRVTIFVIVQRIGGIYFGEGR